MFFRFPIAAEIHILNSYKNTIGKANNICDTTSGGVNTAAKINISKITIFLYFFSVFAVTRFTCVNNIINNGNSNTTPNEKTIEEIKLKYLSKENNGLICFTETWVKKSIVIGIITKYANITPIKKKIIPIYKENNKYLRSFFLSPGFTNNHICIKLIGEEITIPNIIAILI